MSLTNPRPKKSLGQHFLNNPQILAKISSEAGAKNSRVLEIGAGTGLLTRALLDCGASELVALEKDKELIPILAKLAKQYPNRLKVIEGDARHFRLSQTPLAKPFCVVGNLPYYVATNLIFNWSTQTEGITSFCLMVQKEVAVRIAKGSGSAMGVLLKRVFASEVLWDIEKEHFTPPPKVQSCLIRLVPLAAPFCEDAMEELQFLLTTAFTERRKMLANSLKSHPLALDALAKQNISLTIRPQDITPAQWFAVAQTLRESAGKT